MTKLMNKGVRVAAMVTMFVIIIGAVATPMTATGATGATPSRSGNPSIGELADCAARTGELSIVILVDESGSLQQTDPDARRVQAIQAALHGLSTSVDRAAGTEHAFDIKVSMLGFGVSTSDVVDWTALNGSTLPGLTEASQQFASLNHEIDTDYAMALLGARDKLAQLAAPGFSDQCSAILWFTDGQYDIEARKTGETKPYAPQISLNGKTSAAALEEAGKTVLCQPGGVVDALRGSGTQILAVALSSDIAPEDQDFLRAVAGDGATTSCGSPRPDGRPTGTYLSTENVNKLIGEFFDLGTTVGGATFVGGPEHLPVCANSTCESGTHHFTIDPGISAFNLLALTSAPGIDIELTSPESPTPYNISASTPTGVTTLGSAKVQWTWIAADALLLDVKLPAESGPWNGQWGITFIDRGGRNPNAVGDASIYVFGDLEPFIADSDLRAGEASQIKVGVRHREGTPADTSLFAETSVEMVVVDPADGTSERIPLSEPDADGMMTGTWNVPAPKFPASVNLSATLRVTTASGQALSPVTRTVARRVLPPSSYPQVHTASVSFGRIEGAGTAQSSIEAEGGPDAAGCIWIEGATTQTSPKDAGDVAVTSSSGAEGAPTCLRVEKGQRVELPLALATQHGANGAANGTITIDLVSDTNPELLRTTVAWNADLAKSLDVAKAEWIFVVLMVVGVLLPLILMWLLNWFMAVYKQPSSYKYASIPVEIKSSGSIVRTDGLGPGLRLETSDFKAVNGPRRSRSLSVGSLALSSKTSLWPFAAPTGLVVSPGNGVGSVPPAQVGATTSTAPIGFGLGGSIVVEVSLAGLDRRLGDEASAKASPLESGPDAASGHAASRRPDLEGHLVVIAPSASLRIYADHLVNNRHGILGVVDSLVELRRTELDSAGGGEPPPGSGDDDDRRPSDWGAPPQRSSRSRAGSPPPLSARSRAGSKAPSSRTDPPARPADSTPGPDDSVSDTAPPKRPSNAPAEHPERPARLDPPARPGRSPSSSSGSSDIAEPGTQKPDFGSPPGRPG
jgi:hypothetical protein